MSDKDFLRACGLVAIAYSIVTMLGGCGGSADPVDPPVNTIQPVKCTAGACI
jgi:hypothetical protein